MMQLLWREQNKALLILIHAGNANKQTFVYENFEQFSLLRTVFCAETAYS